MSVFVPYSRVCVCVCACVMGVLVLKRLLYALVVN